MRLSPDPVWTILLFVGLGMPIGIHSLPYFQRPPRTPARQVIMPGITYQRRIWQQPRPVVLHVATVDLRHRDLGILVSPGSPGPDGRETTAMTTSEFLQRYQQLLAINASYFYPFQEDAPWAYYPRSGDRVNVVGQAISGGQIYSQGEPGWAMLCFDGQNRARILAEVSCPAGTQQAISGNEMLLVNGLPRAAQQANDGEKPYPRLVLAIDKLGQTLWIVAVDGKQPLYSEGVKLMEIVPVLQQLGADRAINLDGGGSTTMVTAAGSNNFQLLNAPIQNKLPMKQRPVANHLGFFSRRLGNAVSH
jgi:Phosphodiester glycosidase